MTNPADYIYRYAFPSTLPEYEKEGWEYAADAGHSASSRVEWYEKVILIKRKKECQTKSDG
jgi:hypothetical protein